MLNLLIKGDSYPLPNINQLYHAIAEVTSENGNGLQNGFSQVPVHEDSIEITGFVCEFGTYEWLSMPMGIKNAPSWFQRFMENAFASISTTTTICLDDNIVFSDKLEEHLEHTLKVIKTIRENNLVVSLDKCDIAK